MADDTKAVSDITPHEQQTTTSPTTTSKDADKIESDITVYGATSFVAKHVLKYLKSAATKDLYLAKQTLRITLGGRNRAKLDRVLESIAVDDDDDSSSVNYDILVADGNDLIKLKQMATRTKVVLNCAGPYAKYSTEVVAACAGTGTDYVDITGEIHWVSKMRQQYGVTMAKLSGAKIISLCGYDSIPSDIAVYHAIQTLRKSVSENNIQITNARLWHQAFGLPNGGTIHTFCDIPVEPMNDFFVDNGSIKTLRSVPYFVGDPLSISNPQTQKENPKYDQLKRIMAMSEWTNQSLFIEPDFFYGISLPFAMSAVNLKVVQASAVALKYGNNFAAQERIVPLGYFGTKLLSIFVLFPMAMFHCLTLFLVGILKLPVIGKQVANLVPPGSGVPDSLCYIGFNAVYCKVDGVDDQGNKHTAYSYLSFQGDAGNSVTAQCVSEAALALVFSRDMLPTRNPDDEDGFGTPAEMLGDALLKRFQETKVRPVTVKSSVDSPIL